MFQFEVRRATPADLDGMTTVYLSLAAHHQGLAPDAYRVPEPAETRERFRRMLDTDDGQSLHLVAVADGHVLGALDVFMDGVPGPGGTRRPLRTATVGVAVLDEMRGRGIGTALMRAAEEWANLTGIDGLRLEVDVRNVRAERLYRSLGYHPQTTLMLKPLSGGETPAASARLGNAAG
ncbi:MAG: GNAT family N-acetyltransferase [Chloroflexota bacterium]